MSWDFVFGIVIGVSIGLLFVGLTTTVHDEWKHDDLDELDDLKMTEDTNEEVKE